MIDIKHWLYCDSTFVFWHGKMCRIFTVLKAPEMLHLPITATARLYTWVKKTQLNNALVISQRSVSIVSEAKPRWAKAGQRLDYSCLNTRTKSGVHENSDLLF